MRTIKFRAWTGLQMEYDITVGKFGNFYVNPGYKKDGLDPQDSASLTQFTTKYPDNVPVMQFTGLLDKNGKEIYEGDILQIKVISTQCIVVQWTRNGFSPYIKDETDFEIIGNIYENPELIN